MTQKRRISSEFRLASAPAPPAVKKVIYWIVLGWALFVFGSYLYSTAERVLKAFY